MCAWLRCPHRTESKTGHKCLKRDAALEGVFHIDAVSVKKKLTSTSCRRQCHAIGVRHKNGAIHKFPDGNAFAASTNEPFDASDRTFDAGVRTAGIPRMLRMRKQNSDAVLPFTSRNFPVFYWGTSVVASPAKIERAQSRNWPIQSKTQILLTI